MNESLEAPLPATLMIPAYNIVDAIPGLIAVMTPDGEVDCVNRQVLEYLGRSLEDLKQWGITDSVHPIDLPQAMVAWQRARETGSPYECEHRLRRADGEYRWFVSRGIPLRDASDHVVRWFNLLTETHARKQSEELRQVIDALPTMAWCNLPDGANEFLNKRWHDYTGLSPEESHGWGWQAAFHPDDSPRFMEEWRELLISGEPGKIEARLRRFDGVYRWFLICVEPFRDEAGRIVRWFGTSTDIDERRQAEQQLMDQEAELRQILDLTPQFVSVYGPGHERLYANHGMLNYLGVDLEEWRRRFMFREALHRDDWEAAARSFDRAVIDGAGFELEVRLRRPDERYRWFLARCNPVRANGGQLLRWYVACTDIDDRKRNEEKLLQETVALREEVDKTSMFEDIVGASPALASLLSSVSKVANSESTVLITGETGTGKELVARAIHRRSRRGSRAFVAVNCAAIPRDLIASELFGHEKGAFTGAIQRRIGRFELADGGTIFLDEVGELSPDMQVALLRVLQERAFERVGGRDQIRVDVRIVAATNRDLSAAVVDGRFRQDLFYRLNVFPLEVPPLRERREDIPLLVDYFVGRYARKAGKTFQRVAKRTLDRLRSYSWPGNVRELQNVIERSVIVSDTDEFTVDERWLSTPPRIEGRLGLFGVVAAHEKAMVEEALRACGGRVFGPSGAAARLGIQRSTLESKIRRLKIDKTRFRAKEQSGT